MIVSGNLSPLLRTPYVVGVCSFEERPSESVGDASEPWPTGELALMLRSYSSSASASDSGYDVPPENAMLVQEERNAR
jgi:hypothetical protein